MIDPEREELLSAYLDGEVSPEERARVEQWLAESSELRQLRDELLSIRTDLQALPQHQVGHDLAAVVMHRSSTASADPSSRSAPAADSTTASENSLGSIVSEWWNRGSQGRRFLWPALAVAAALAILVFDARQRPTEFEVAQAPEAAPAELQEEAPAGAAASAGQPSIGGKPETPMPEASAPPAADSSIRGGAPVPVPPPSAEERAPATERNQIDFFKAMPESAPADGATREAAPTNAPGPVPKAGGALYGKRAELAAQALAVETIVCPVTPRYLQDRKFEKLLDSNGIRWKQMPIPPQLQMQATPQSPRTAPLESLGKTPLQSLYLLQLKSEQVDGILSQVPQADRLMEGNRLNTFNPQQQKKEGASAGVQVMLVAPVDGTTPAAPAAKSTR